MTNKKVKDTVRMDLSDIPVYCGHEHWGSLSSFGFEAEGFRPDCIAGAVPQRETTPQDILFDPYMSGNFQGASLAVPDFLEGESGREVFERISSVLSSSGTWIATARGINELYGHDVSSFDEFSSPELKKQVVENYSATFRWYRSAMEKSGLTGVIRPVHPSWYFLEDEEKDSLEERSLIRTNMRIDPFLTFYDRNSAALEFLVEVVDVEPIDGPSWKEFLDKLFNLASEKGCVGIKQFQAYHRDLDFRPVNEAQVKFGNINSEEEIRNFQDWIVNLCCELAHERGWSHQIHTGTHNFPHSNPLPLKTLAERYSNMKIVMLHCWPYIDESGFLAKNIPNMYIDTCWQPILNPRFLEQSFASWLNYVPLNKITCSNDATSVEMAAGSAALTREILARSLKNASFGETEDILRQRAFRLLFENSVELYG